MGVLRKLYEKGEANAERSFLGCLTANVLAFFVLAIILWLFGERLHLGT